MAEIETSILRIGSNDLILQDAEARTKINDMYITDTASGSIASFPDGADNVPVKSLTVNIEPVQSGSGDPSPTNVRPISGHTTATVTVSPTTDAQDGTSYTIDLDGTRYGGTLNVETGVLTVDRAYVDMGTLTWTAWEESGSYIFNAVVTGKKQTREAQLICSRYKHNTNVSAWSDLHNGDITGAINYRVYVRDLNFNSVESFQSAMNGVQLVYELETDQTIQLSPTEVQTLLGQNNIWNDCGNTEVEYRADTKLYINKVLNA